jgi:hypothetical protein
MLLRTAALLLGLCLAAGVGIPALAQQSPPAAPPQTSAASPPCEAFTKNADDDWVAKQDMTLPGPTGPVQIQAGSVVSDELQDELADRCKSGDGEQ